MLARAMLSLSLLSALYLPTPLDVLIDTIANVHGIDQELMRCVVMAESDGDPEAVGAAGEIGLMQIMPETGALLAREAGVADYDLYNPAHNLWLGAYGLARWPQWWTTYEGCKDTEEESP